MARIAGSIGAETAERVREQALKLFAAKSFAAVSMREIAAAVGVQAAALYNHFPNKQALLADLMLSHMDGLLAAWDNEAVAGEEPVAAVHQSAVFMEGFNLFWQEGQGELLPGICRTPEQWSDLHQHRPVEEGSCLVEEVGKFAAVGRIVPFAKMDDVIIGGTQSCEHLTTRGENLLPGNTGSRVG